MTNELDPDQIIKKIDWLTTAAIAAVAISFTQIIHEGLHVLTCVAVGAQLKAFSALHVSCLNETALQSKLISGSASIVNILAAIILWVLLRRSSHRSSEMQFFLWLFMLMNGLLGAGYWFFSGIANIGDWANVIDGWSPHWLWRLGMGTIGLAAYTFTVWFALYELGRIIGGDEFRGQIGRATKVGLLSYGTVFFVIFLAGIFNPHRITGLPALAALALALGGMSPLLWMMQWFRSRHFKKISKEPLTIDRKWSWIIAAIVVVFLYSLILGRGISFLDTLKHTQAVNCSARPVSAGT